MKLKKPGDHGAERAGNEHQAERTGEEHKAQRTEEQQESQRTEEHKVETTATAEVRCWQMAMHTNLYSYLLTQGLSGIGIYRTIIIDVVVHI